MKLKILCGYSFNTEHIRINTVDKEKRETRGSERECKNKSK